MNNELFIKVERVFFEEYILKDRGPGYLSKYWNEDTKEQDYADEFIQGAWKAWIARASLSLD